jgi:hypothetical protein
LENNCNKKNFFNMQAFVQPFGEHAHDSCPVKAEPLAEAQRHKGAYESNVQWPIAEHQLAVFVKSSSG